MSKRALGKGLDALIQSGGEERPTGLNGEELPLDVIDPNEKQPRRRFDDESMRELTASVREKGIIQPIIVERNDDRFRIVAGERRYRAAKSAGLDKIPVIIRDYASDERLEISLIENIQRENLNPIEEALTFEAIMKQSGIGQEELAKRVGKSRSAIANSVRLLKLNAKYQEALEDGSLSPGHARAILAVSDPSDQDDLYSRIVEAGLSVREAEVLVEKLNRGNRKEGKKPPEAVGDDAPEIQRIQQEFIESLGTKVQVRGTLSKGKVEITYFTKEDLTGLYDLLVKKP